MSSNYPPQQGWAQPPPAAPPRKRHVLRWIAMGVLGFVVIIIVASIAAGGGTDTTTGASDDAAAVATTAAAKSSTGGVSRGLGSADATRDVKVDTGSLSSSFGLARATLTITNHSSKRSDYYVEAALLNAAGENVGTANALVTAVEPGQVAHTELTGGVTGKLHSLKITQVQRTASA